MYLSRSALVFYILKEKQSPYSILFSKAEPFLIISIFYVISTSGQSAYQRTNFFVLSFPRPFFQGRAPRDYSYTESYKVAS